MCPNEIGDYKEILKPRVVETRHKMRKEALVFQHGVTLVREIS